MYLAGRLRLRGALGSRTDGNRVAEDCLDILISGGTRLGDAKRSPRSFGHCSRQGFDARFDVSPQHRQMLNQVSEVVDIWLDIDTGCEAACSGSAGPHREHTAGAAPVGVKK